MAISGPTPLPAAPAATSGAPGRGLLPDYNRAAVAYWSLLVVGGTVALATAVVALLAMPVDVVWQVLAGSLFAAVVGMFPLQVPKTKTSFAVGDIFIFLLLMLHGSPAAVIAATAESAACAWRTSNRWSSRIVGPASAAVAMALCGAAFEQLVPVLQQAGLLSQGAAFCAILIFAALYFVVSPTLVTTVIYLKRRRAPSRSEWLITFGWLGMGYMGSASVAGVLFVAFNQFGPTSVLVAVPMIGMFVTSLRAYFAQQEAAEREAVERARRERAESAERESFLTAQHLRELELSDRRFQSAFTHAAIGMALVTSDGRLVQVNAALCALLGREAPALVGGAFSDFIESAAVPEIAQLTRRLRAGEFDSFQHELGFRHALGHEVQASIHCSCFAQDVTTESHLIVQAFDVTARRRAEARLQHLAFHDSLTGLSNRSRLLELVTQAIDDRRTGTPRPFSVLHMNFGRFKQLNDSFGRGVGDQFLVMVARRLQALLRPGDVPARLEGDDFAVLAMHLEGGTQHAVALAERVRQAFAAPVLVDDTEVHCGASIGITFSDIGYERAEDALRDADLAMSKAKADGRARYALFDPTLHERATVQLLLERDLRRALDGGALALAFQPVFSIEPQRLVGFEALARWPHPIRGMVSPADFIPVAEESGLIVVLTQWALREACRQMRVWRDRLPGAAALFVNVNISGQDLCESGFAETVRSALAQHALPAECLTLEITETALMQQLEIGARTLAKLREIGVGLSVDDFGTGYSSLSHLSTLPISSLKIDRSFVDKLGGASVDTEIVRAVIQLGHVLGKRVIAEGIESAAQLDRLRKLGCGYAQGFLLARPLSPAQIDAMLPAALAPDTVAAARPDGGRCDVGGRPQAHGVPASAAPARALVVHGEGCL